MNSFNDKESTFPGIRLIRPTREYQLFLDYLIDNESIIMDPLPIISDADIGRPSDRGVVARLDVAEARSITQLIEEGQLGFGYRAEHAAWRRVIQAIRREARGERNPGIFFFPALLAYLGPMPRYGGNKESIYDVERFDDKQGFRFGNIFWERRVNIADSCAIVPEVGWRRVAKAHRFFKIVDGERRAEVEMRAARARSPLFTIPHAAAA